jgi:PIN domain nuclease of toxin-antitoxin system
MDRATISAVNLAETVQKLVQEGSAPRLTESLLRQLELEVVDWSEDTAYRSAEFARLGKSHGLSLGDRACLTLAKQLNATAVTSDSAGRSCPTLALQ